MPPESADRLGAQAPAQPPALLLGPGARSEALGPHLQILGGSAELQVLDDLARALFDVPPAAQLVVDADEVPIEDLGILRRFLAAGPARTLILLGDDPRNRTLRAFSGLGSVRFLAWPPDLEQLAALADPARRSPREPRAKAGRSGENSELGALGAAAELPPLEAPYVLPARRAPERATSSLAAAELVDPLGSSAQENPDRGRQLADVLERFEDAFRSVKHAIADSADVLPSVLACTEELDQLLQWSRATGGADPMPRAESTSTALREAFDLGQLLEEVLAGVAVGGADAPRFLYRSRGDLAARGPRAELAQAFGALFRGVRDLAGPGSLIQVAARDGSGAGAPLMVVLNFPAGPLDPDDLLRVYREGGRVEAGASPELERLAGQVAALAGLGAAVELSSETRQRLLLELGFERELAGSHQASSLAGA